MKEDRIMKHDKFDVVLQFGQLDTSAWLASKYLSNEHYGWEIIKHNVSVEEAQQYVKSHKWDLIDKKEMENHHVKDFHATCFLVCAHEE